MKVIDFKWSFHQLRGITVLVVEMIHYNKFLYNSCTSKKKKQKNRRTQPDETCPWHSGKTGNSIVSTRLQEGRNLYSIRVVVDFGLQLQNERAGMKLEDRLTPQFTHEEVLNRRVKRFHGQLMIQPEQAPRVSSFSFFKLNNIRYSCFLILSMTIVLKNYRIVKFIEGGPLANSNSQKLLWLIVIFYDSQFIRPVGLHYFLVLLTSLHLPKKEAGYSQAARTGNT